MGDQNNNKEMTNQEKDATTQGITSRSNSGLEGGVQLKFSTEEPETTKIVEDMIENIKNKNNPKSKSDNNPIMGYIQSMLDKLDELQKDVNYLKKHKDKIVSSNSKELLNVIKSQLPDIISKSKQREENTDSSVSVAEAYDITKEFVKIYHSKSKKMTLTINEELHEQVKDLIAKHYEVKDNDSNIMDIALMIALLKICR